MDASCNLVHPHNLPYPFPDVLIRLGVGQVEEDHDAA